MKVEDPPDDLLAVVLTSGFYAFLYFLVIPVTSSAQISDLFSRIFFSVLSSLNAMHTVSIPPLSLMVGMESIRVFA